MEEEQKKYPLTIGDMVRAMCDEELAEMMATAIVSAVLQIGMTPTEEQRKQFYENVHDTYLNNFKRVVDEVEA